MTARRLLNAMHSTLVEAHGPEKVEEMLRGKQRWRESIDPSEVVWEEVA